MGCVAVNCGSNIINQGVKAVLSFQIINDENDAPYDDLRDCRVTIVLRNNRAVFTHYTWDGAKGGEDITVDSNGFVTITIHEGMTINMLGSYDIEGVIDAETGRAIIGRRFAVEAIPSVAPVIHHILKKQ